MSKLFRVLAVAVAVLLIPASAWGVNLSSNDGVGNQHVTAHGDQSFASTGQLRSTSGNRVYLRGIVVYNSYPDYTCDRISPNTTSSKYVERGGTCRQWQSIPPSADAAGWKICRDRSGLPDGCGSQSEERF